MFDIKKILISFVALITCITISTKFINASEFKELSPLWCKLLTLDETGFFISKMQLEINFEPEIWKDLKGYEGIYQISNFIRVKGLKRTVWDSRYGHKKIKSHILKPFLMGEYYCVGLSRDSKGECKTLHRLIATHFIPNPENKPEVNHKDGNKLNNDIPNLEWVTASENVLHAYKIGLNKAPKGEKHPLSILKDNDIIQIRILINKGLMLKEIANKFNVNRGTISDIKNNRTWKHI